MAKNAKGYGRDPWISFWDHYDVDLFGCWIWRGGKNKRGQGVVRFRGRNQVTSRVAWQLARGPIPKGMWVLHRCDNPSCINPEHLFIGTAKDNVRDMITKGREYRPLLRTPTCHPDRPYFARGRCEPCYQSAYRRGLLPVRRRDAHLSGGIGDAAEDVGVAA